MIYYRLTRYHFHLRLVIGRHLEILPVTPSLRSRAGSEPMRFAQGKLREGSLRPVSQILRCAQDDSQDSAQVRSRGSLLSKCLGDWLD